MISKKDNYPDPGYLGPYLPLPARTDPYSVGLPFTTAAMHDSDQRYGAPRPSQQWQRVIGPVTAARARGYAGLKPQEVCQVDPDGPGHTFQQGRGWRRRS